MSERTTPKPVDPRMREQPLRAEVNRLKALIADMVIFDRASNHPTAREVWTEARAIHDQEDTP
jgi:hypothetical protein